MKTEVMTKEELLETLIAFDIKKLTKRSAGYMNALMTELSKDLRNVTKHEQIIRFIISMIEEHYKIDLSIRTRRGSHVIPRYAMMYLLRYHTYMGLNEIKEYLSVKNHDTVLRGIDKFKTLMNEYPHLRNTIKEFEKRIIDESNRIQEVLGDRPTTHRNAG